MTPVSSQIERSTRPSTVAAAVAAALGVLLAPQAMAQAASSADLQALKDEVQQLQRKIDQLEAQQKQQQQTQPAQQTQVVVTKKTPEVVENSSNHKLSIQSADGQYSIALTGRLHLDVGGYDDFRPDNTAVGTQKLSSGFNARRARIGVTGKAGGDWTYQFIYDAGNSSDNAAGGIEWAQIAYVGIKGVQIDLPGYSEPPFTLETSQSSNDIMFLERAVPVNVATGLGTGDFRANTGVRVYGDRYFFGAYLTGPQNGDSHANAQERFGTFGRASVQLLQSDDYNLHLGGGVFELIKAPNTGPGTPYTVTLSDRPDLRIDPTALLTTGAIGTLANPVTAATVLDGELAGGWHSVFAMGEYFHYDVERRGLGTNKFNGGYAEVGWTLTGEHRRYLPLVGSYSGINPSHPFGGANGGAGAWEIAFRYDQTNLTDNFIVGNALAAQPDAVNGGRLKDYTVGVNWYVNSYMRFMLNYVRSTLDKANDKAVAGAPLGVPVGYSFNGFALRSQVAW
jgi:phosphate-selective porin OprO/OprP